MKGRWQRVLPTLAALFVLGSALATLASSPGEDPDELRPVTSFAGIEDEAERSRALFLEAARVLTHPRCVNCHPAGDSPHQGDEAAPHEPPVTRGKTGHGVVGMRCVTCHHEENYEPAEVPGAPHWHLAPRSMAWEGLSAGEICRQIKDRRRNGDRDMDAIVHHMSADPLVLWGWNPGPGRESVPGTPESFAALISAWAESGAVCPD